MAEETVEIREKREVDLVAVEEVEDVEDVDEIEEEEQVLLYPQPQSSFSQDLLMFCNKYVLEGGGGRASVRNAFVCI